MQKEINQYVHNIFAPYPKVRTAKELEEELSANLTEKYQDYKSKGYSETEAYQMTINSIGDVSELIDSINLQQSELEKAIQMDFSRSRMVDSDFRDVSIREGKFKGSDLKGSDFSNSDLTDCEFKSCNLGEAIFENVNLTGAQFSGSNFKGSTFKNCNYHRSFFKSSNLTGIDFDGQMFEETIFEMCTLKKASFRNTNLKKVQFRLSDVKKVDFSGAKMDKLTYNFLKAGKADLSDVMIIQ